MSTYTLVKVEELNGGVPWSTIADADLIPVKKSGIDGFAPFSVLRTQVPNLGFLSGTFDNTDLSAYIWTLNHAKNTRNCFLLIRNPAGEYQDTVPYLVDSNNIAINFGGPIESGDWEYVFVYFSAAAEAVYPDPIYMLAADAPVTTTPTIDYGIKQAPITVVSFTLRRYGNFVIGTILITSTVAVTVLDVATLSAHPAYGVYIPFNMLNSANYEGGYGAISTSGILTVSLGKANQQYCANFSYSIV